jgi:hypothetical protein
MTQIEIQITLQIFTLLIGLYLALFKSYFHEKGKNIATKEDIEEITNKIELVKSDIGILTHKKISLVNEKQNSLLDFNSKYTAWLNFILNSSIVVETQENTFIEKTESTLNNLFHDLSISEAKMNIFFHSDKELKKLKETLIFETIKLSNLFILNLAKNKPITEKINLIMKIPNEIPDNTFKMGELEKYYKERFSIVEEFIAEKLKMYKPISILSFEFSKLVSERIHEN